MFSFFIKLDNFFKSKKYRYFDIFLGVSFLFYCLYLFLVHNEINYTFIFFGFLGLLLGIFDVTRKINIYIQKKMLGLKS